jgi:hypothetical protein
MACLLIPFSYLLRVPAATEHGSAEWQHGPHCTRGLGLLRLLLGLLACRPEPQGRLGRLPALRALLILPDGAGNRRFGLLSALRAHTNAPYNTDFLCKKPKAA